MIGFFGIILATALLLFLLFLTTRGQTKHDQRLIAALLVLGGGISIGAFVALPWVAYASADVFSSNVAWTSQKLQTVTPILEALGQEDSRFSSVMEADALRSALCDRSATQICNDIESETTLTGWQIFLLSWRVSPLLSLDMGWMLLIACLALIIGAASFRGRRIGLLGRGRSIGMATLGIAIFSFIVAIPFLDTLGTYTNLRLHLVSALAELHVTSAPWLLAMSMIIILIALIFMPSGPDLDKTYHRVDIAYWEDDDV